MPKFFINPLFFQRKNNLVRRDKAYSGREETSYMFGDVSKSSAAFELTAGKTLQVGPREMGILPPSPPPPSRRRGIHCKIIHFETQ